jgi:hypothetical protein
VDVGAEAGGAPVLQAATASASSSDGRRRRTGSSWQPGGSRRERARLPSDAVADLVSTCVWRIRPELVVALDRRFGEPVDSYVNGSQVWLRDDGPDGLTLEWRLHPVAGFSAPRGVSTYELLPAVALAVAGGEEPPAPPERLWDGLEAFSAYGEEVEPAPLAAATGAALGLAPDAAGLVDHAVIGATWEASGRRTSIVAALFDQLTT